MRYGLFPCFIISMVAWCSDGANQCEQCELKLVKTKDIIHEVILSLKNHEDILKGLPGTTTTLPNRISFYARLSKSIALGTSQTVIFDDVVTNNGHTYNPLTGYFTAPQDGTFCFASSFVSDGKSIHLQLMKNGDEVGRGVGYPDHASTGSLNVIINLKKYDAVRLRHYEKAGGETIHGNLWSSFSGYLL